MSEETPTLCFVSGKSAQIYREARSVSPLSLHKLEKSTPYFRKGSQCISYPLNATVDNVLAYECGNNRHDAYTLTLTVRLDAYYT